MLNADILYSVMAVTERTFPGQKPAVWWRNEGAARCYVLKDVSCVPEMQSGYAACCSCP